MQYFKPLTHREKSTRIKSLKVAQFCGKSTGLTTLLPKRAESDLTDHGSRESEDEQHHGGGFDAQQILSSLTNISSCKMCSLYTEYTWS